MSWLKPFVTVYPGNRREFVLPPGQNVISYGLIVGPTFWFEGKRMVDTIGCFRIRVWNSVLRIAIDSVRTDFSHQRSDGLGPGFASLTRALSPHHHRKEDAYSSAMEIGDRQADSGTAPWHPANPAKLVAMSQS